MNELQIHMSQNLLPILIHHQKTVKQMSQVIEKPKPHTDYAEQLEHKTD